MENCSTCRAPLCISHLSIFGNLSVRQRNLIIANVVRIPFKKGEIFLHEQDPLSSFVVINRGRFKATSVLEDGHRRVLNFYRVGDFFGETSLFKPMNAPYTIECVEDGNLCTIPSHLMQELIKKEPDLALSLLSSLSNRIESLESELKRVHVDRLDHRLYALLESLEQDYGEIRNTQRILRNPLSQEEMANRLGSSREAISRTLKKLELSKKIKCLPHKEIILY
jgi:CRP/FNR family transcriptional regulator, anaerobic regulatory protein